MLWKQYVNWHPISFFSRKMTPAETWYSTFDRELLAVYLAIKHFHHFLEGRHFHVLTDHKPLTFALNTHSDCHSPCQACQLDYISQFTSTIHHVYGLDNVVADALPILRLICYSPTVDFAAMTKTHATDPQIWALQSSPSSTLVVEAIPLANSCTPLYCDTSTGTQHPLVPLAWQCTVFDSLRGLSHPGIRATQKLITVQFVWPGINADAHCWTCSYVQCQCAKIRRHSTESTTPTRLMDGCSTIFSPWNPHHSQGGHILNGCKDGVRHNFPSPWRILRPLSNIFSAWPIRLCIQPQNSHADYPTSSTSS